MAVMRRLYLLALLLACQLAALLAPIRGLWALLTNPARAFEIIIAYDRLGNAVINGEGEETISSRANRARASGRRWGCVLCWLLDAIDADHCRKSAGK